MEKALIVLLERLGHQLAPSVVILLFTDILSGRLDTDKTLFMEKTLIVLSERLGHQLAPSINM